MSPTPIYGAVAIENKGLGECRGVTSSCAWSQGQQKSFKRCGRVIVGIEKKKVLNECSGVTSSCA